MRKLAHIPIERSDKGITFTYRGKKHWMTNLQIGTLSGLESRGDVEHMKSDQDGYLEITSAYIGMAKMHLVKRVGRGTFKMTDLGRAVLWRIRHEGEEPPPF